MNNIKTNTPTRFERGLARSLARKAKDLLVAPDLAKQVHALDPLETYYIVKELGVESATPILLAASRSQLQSIIDLDCWENDRPCFEDIESWLAPFAALGPEYLATAFFALEDELQVLFLADRLLIFEKQDEHDQPGTDRKVTNWHTPDNAFVVEPRSDDEHEINPVSLLQTIYMLKPQDGFSILTAARWETTSPLEEDAFRFRANRLEEMGFPPIDRAQSLFNPPPRQSVAPCPSANHTQTNKLPALYAAPLSDSNLLSLGLNQIEDPAFVTYAEETLIHLVNTAIIAYNESPRSISHTRKMAERVRDTLCLGIEVAGFQDTELKKPYTPEAIGTAARTLERWNLFDLFRHGYHAARPLQREAARLQTDPVFKTWLEKVETELDDYSQDRLDRAFIRALVGPHLAISGTNRLQPDELRAFSSLEDIEDAWTRLNEIAEKIL